MVTIAASRAWAVSTLRWRSWISHLLIVDAHLGVAARLRYLDKGTELLPPSRSSSRPGCRQARSTSGGSTAGLRITVVANPQGTIAPLALRNQLSCQWNVLGPLKAAVSLALLPTTRCRLLHRRVSRSFCRGRFGCAAAPAVAMPESDLEVTAMLSRAAERVGLKWRKPPCPEPSRLDDWFLGVACAGSQRPAPGAYLPDVHEELTGRRQHLLLPETDLLTPPPSPPSVVQLGVTGSPRWSGQLRCKCVLILSPPGRANRASSTGPVGTRLVSSGDAYVACGDAAST